MSKDTLREELTKIIGEQGTHLVSDTVEQLLTLISKECDRADRGARKDEWKKLLGKDFKDFYPVDNFHDWLSVPSMYINERLTEISAPLQQEKI